MLVSYPQWWFISAELPHNFGHPLKVLASTTNITISIPYNPSPSVHFQFIGMGEMYSTQVPEDGEGSGEAWINVTQRRPGKQILVLLSELVFHRWQIKSQRLQSICTCLQMPYQIVFLSVFIKVCLLTMKICFTVQNEDNIH